MNIPDALGHLIENARKMLPLYLESGNAAVKAAADNLTWNIKKVLGEAGEERIDVAEFVKRSSEDFAKIASGLSDGAGGQAFAASFASKINDITAGATATAAAAVTAVGGQVQQATGAVAAAVASTAQSVISAVSGFDLGGFMKGKVASAGEPLDWQRSLTDLCKLLGLDSSLDGRKKVAVALGFSEAEIAAVGSEEGNEALRKALLNQIAANGGTLPAGLV